MGYHPRIESGELASFVTTRTRGSELWFINNRRLENSVLSYAAKFAKRYNVQLYALAIEGSHIQGPALFPNANRADFMRDFNSAVARAVPRYVKRYPGGRLWGRRYSAEFLPAPEDIEEYFFYTVLQPVKDGLVERISDYPGYNCFSDAVRGNIREFKLVRWGEYYAAKRHNPDVTERDFTEIVELHYERLPGYEQLSKKEYVKLMHRKLEERRLAIVRERKNRGLGFVGREKLKMTPAGVAARRPKTATRQTHRPRILCVCPRRRAQYKAWYFKIYFEYREASESYRGGERTTEFPAGTYPPWLPRAIEAAV